MKDQVKAIEAYRRRNGRLPPEPGTTAEAFALLGYRDLGDGSCEVRYVGFDGPDVTYSQKDDRWRCGR